MVYLNKACEKLNNPHEQPSEIDSRHSIMKSLNKGRSPRSFRRLLKLEIISNGQIVFDLNNEDESKKNLSTKKKRDDQRKFGCKHNYFDLMKNIISTWCKQEQLVVDEALQEKKQVEITGNMYLLMGDKTEKTLQFRIRKTSLFSKTIYLVIFIDTSE